MGHTELQRSSKKKEKKKTLKTKTPKQDIKAYNSQKAIGMFWNSHRKDSSVRKFHLSEDS